MPPVERRPSYIQFTPKRAMASFENLVALANYEERLKEARKIVWRDRGELPVEVHDFRECLEHSARGGMRAAILAFSIRSGVNFLLVLTRITKVRKELRFAIIRHALLGSDSFHFAGMLGSFVLLYKYILNALPLLLPPKPHQMSSPFHDENDDDEDLEIGPAGPRYDRKARLSVNAKARRSLLKHQTRDWFAPVAGAIAGGVAVMFEKRSRRVAIGQQLLVRGMQGSYNAFSTKHNFTIPHGDVLLFSLACGQIMYAWLMRPDTISRSYRSWISHASMLPPTVVEMNRTLVREGMFDISNLDAVIAIPNIHPLNKTELLTRRAAALLPMPNYGPNFVPCASIHPSSYSCFLYCPNAFFEVFKWMVPVYGALHFIPMLLFKRQRFMKEPIPMLVQTALGTTRSCAFLGVFVMSYQAMFCGKHNLYNFLEPKGIIPPKILYLLISKGSFWVLGALTGLSLLVEDKRRRAELAMYVLPKGLESAWVTARGKGLVMKTGQVGEMLMGAVGMGMVMRAYQNDPQHLSGLVRRILYQFVGPN